MTDVSQADEPRRMREMEAPSDSTELKLLLPAVIAVGFWL